MFCCLQKIFVWKNFTADQLEKWLRGATVRTILATVHAHLQIQLALVKRTGGSGFTLVNGAEPYATIRSAYAQPRRASSRVASRRVASRSLASPPSCSPDGKNEVGFVCSFFFFSSLNWPSARAGAISNVCRVGFTYRAARWKGYAIPDGHVSASRTGIHEDGQGLDWLARPYKGVLAKQGGNAKGGRRGRERERKCSRKIVEDWFEVREFAT